MIQAPLLYIGEVTPDLALSASWKPLLAQFGNVFLPKGIIILSSTWTTNSPAIGTTTNQQLSYDFPNPTKKQLRIVYPAARAPQMAEHVLPILQKYYPKAHQKQSKRLDHGAWIPLYHLFPSALIPVLQVSLPLFDHPKHYVEFGKVLSEICGNDYLLVGSDASPQLSNLFWVMIGMAEKNAFSAQYMLPPLEADVPLTVLSFNSEKAFLS